MKSPLSPPIPGPSGLQKTGSGTCTIDLSWTDYSNHEEGFELVISPLDGSELWTILLDANATSYTVTGLDEAAEYGFEGHKGVTGHKGVKAIKGSRPILTSSLRRIQFTVATRGAWSGYIRSDNFPSAKSSRTTSTTTPAVRCAGQVSVSAGTWRNPQGISRFCSAMN